MRLTIVGYQPRMGFLFGLVKTVLLVFTVIVALLVAIDGSLFANLLGKGGKTD